MNPPPDARGVALAPEPLRSAVAAVLAADGADPAVARLIADHLVDADLADHASHGVYRLTEYHQACMSGQIDAAARPQITDDGGATMMVDGRRGFGHLAMRFTADAAVERAGRHGVCVATVRRGSHIGRLGDHVGYVAEQGLIGIVMANDSGTNQVVAPHGGGDGRLGTNPLAVGVPRAHPPHLVFDMATSAISHGAARLKARWAGADDVSADLLEPAAGHKGFGLALAVEVLAGILSGAGFSGPDPGLDHQGVCLIVIDPARFGGRDALARSVDSLVEWVKASPPAGAEPVVVPGERGALARGRATTIDIDPRTWRELTEVFAATGVTPPPYEPSPS